jgi:hypothetical protein
MKTYIVSILLLLLPFSTTYAGEADIVKVEVAKMGKNTYRFDVTVFHNDAGWGHYADQWDIVCSDGTILAVRTLLHPHVDEQPFTRSLPGVKIPEGIEHLSVRAHDSIHEYGGKELAIEISR